jgi:hypothetical protein
MTHKIVVLIDGEELSEEVIFRALKSVVNNRVAELAAELEEAVIQAACEELDQQHLATYKDWLNENASEILKAMKIEKISELTEFLEASFLEHFVSLPSSKIEIVNELVAENKALHEKIDRQIFEEVHISEATEKLTRKEVLAEIHQQVGCTLMTKGKLETLCEGMPFANRESFKNLALQVYEQHFSKKPVSRSDVLSEEYFGEGDGRHRGSSLAEAATRLL